jgi:hypothetical protein
MTVHDVQDSLARYCLHCSGVACGSSPLKLSPDHPRPTTQLTSSVNA